MILAEKIRRVAGRNVRFVLRATAGCSRSVTPARDAGSRRAADIAVNAVRIRDAATLPSPCLRAVRQPEAGQRHAREADSEFLQRRAARNGLSQALCQFIELVVHIFSFVAAR